MPGELRVSPPAVGLGRPGYFISPGSRPCRASQRLRPWETEHRRSLESVFVLLEGAQR